MTSPKNPFEEMIRFGQEMARSISPALEHFTPHGFEALMPTMPKDLMEAWMGKGISPEGLDAKTRLLLTLGSLTILGAQAEAQIRITVRHALEAGATGQEIAETIAMMGVFGGLPAMNKAMTLAGEVMESHNKDGGKA